MKSYKLSEAEDLLIGKKGTKARDEYEFELKPDGADFESVPFFYPR